MRRKKLPAAHWIRPYGCASSNHRRLHIPLQSIHVAASVFNRKTGRQKGCENKQWNAKLSPLFGNMRINSLKTDDASCWQLRKSAFRSTAIRLRHVRWCRPFSMLLLQNIHLKMDQWHDYFADWKWSDVNVKADKKWQSILPVFLYCDNITLPKCPRPNTLSNRNESIVNPVDDGNCDDDWRRDSYALSLYWSPRTTCGRHLFAPDAAAAGNVSPPMGCCGWNGWYGILNCGVVGCCTIGDCATYWALFATFKLSNGWMICVNSISHYYCSHSSIDEK